MKGRVIAAVVAFVVVVALFAVMQQLIRTEARAEVPPKTPRLVNFIREPPAPEPEEPRPDLPRKTPPVVPETPRGVDPGGPPVNPVPPVDDEPRSRHPLPPPGPGLASDAAPVPLVRVSPTYPPQAAERKVEGWVVVEFSITATGSVDDVEVLASQPPGVFDAAAVRAVRKWKYRPEVENGIPVVRSGVQTKVVFELEED